MRASVVLSAVQSNNKVTVFVDGTTSTLTGLVIGEAGIVEALRQSVVCRQEVGATVTPPRGFVRAGESET